MAEKITKMFETKYKGSYYIANIIQNVLSEPLEYAPLLASFCGDEPVETFFEAFPKESALHKFIKFILYVHDREELLEDFPDDYDPKKFKETSMEYWLKSYKIRHFSSKSWIKTYKEKFFIDTISSYYDELMLTGISDELYAIRSEEIFFILFQNRHICKSLMDWISSSVSKSIKEDFPDDLSKDGVLKRKTIPSWVKKAVLFRDRGRCVFCDSDLSGMLSTRNKQEYDHIIPLNLGGINDVANIQLLCAVCNNKKSGKYGKTSHKYEKLY